MTDFWLSYSCCVQEIDVAIAETCLQEAGALSVSCVAGENVGIVVDELEGRLPLWPVCKVSGLFVPEAKLESIEQVLTANGVLPRQTGITVVSDRNWHDLWRDKFLPQRFGEGLWVCPTWTEPPTDAKSVVLIDPGMAFGTGNHETTALCLEWLSMCDAVAGAAVLDYGCGSGIIGLAAAKLGAAEVTAVDIDDTARKVCQGNAILNGLSNTIIGDPSIANGHHYDVVVANILLEPLVQLADQLSRLMRPGGHIVLSGILVEQIPTLLAAYSSKYDMEPPWRYGDWALLTGTLRDA
ncbi:MAG TPA: 50S ribosomal protein L11 methyltransferase [Gammaproteobacteria bacterium]|nr:50S ribosomal protein L11 methyltransferase [Gammaproteobacteria bacterium]